MRCFRIGRKPPGPWTNRTPPIRGGVFEKEEKLARESEVANVAAKVVSDVGDLEKAVEGDLPRGVRRRTPPVVELGEDDAPLTEKSAASHSPIPEKTERPPPAPTGYADVAMQQEIDQAIRDYPSLEADVQQEITLKFRAMHQKIRDEGFYDCPHIEYGKEMVRYSLLFTGFLTALCYEWYMTSAVFLGLFWVSNSRSPFARFTI